MSDPKACHVPFPDSFPGVDGPLPYLPPLLPRIDHHVYARTGFVIAMNGEEIARRLRLEVEQIAGIMDPDIVRVLADDVRDIALRKRLAAIDLITSHLVGGQVYELSLEDLVLLGLYHRP